METVDAILVDSQLLQVSAKDARLLGTADHANIGGCPRAKDFGQYRQIGCVSSTHQHKERVIGQLRKHRLWIGKASLAEPGIVVEFPDPIVSGIDAGDLTVEFE